MVGSLHGNACELDESNDDKMDLNYTFAPAREPGEFARQGGNRYWVAEWFLVIYCLIH